MATNNKTKFFGKKFEKLPLSKKLAYLDQITKRAKANGDTNTYNEALDVQQNLFKQPGVQRRYQELLDSNVDINDAYPSDPEFNLDKIYPARNLGPLNQQAATYGPYGGQDVVPPTPPAVTVGQYGIENLAKAKELRDLGYITQAQFNKAKGEFNLKAQTPGTGKPGDYIAENYTPTASSRNRVPDGNVNTVETNPSWDASPMYSAMDSYNKWSDKGKGWFTKPDPITGTSNTQQPKSTFNNALDYLPGTKQTQTVNTPVSTNVSNQTVQSAAQPVVNANSPVATQEYTPVNSQRYQVGGRQPFGESFSARPNDLIRTIEPTVPTQTTPSTGRVTGTPRQAATLITGVEPLGMKGMEGVPPVPKGAVAPYGAELLGGGLSPEQSAAAVTNAGVAAGKAGPSMADGNYESGGNAAAGGMGAIGSLFKLAGSTNPYAAALSFLPGVANLASGIFGKNQTSEATTVDRSSINQMPTRYNINPQLASNQRSYNTALETVSKGTAGGNTVAAAKALNADTQMNNSRLYGEKYNQENKMQADKANMGFRADVADAGMLERYKRDYDMAQGQLGVGGNLARSGYQSAADAATTLVRDRKASMMQAMTAGLGMSAISGNSGATDYLNNKLGEYMNMFNFK